MKKGNQKKVPELRFPGFEGEWEEKQLYDTFKQVIDFRGRTPKKLGMEWGGDIPSLSALNVKMGFIDLTVDPHYGSTELYKKWMTQGELEKGDILFTMEAPLGNVALIPDDKKYILSQRVVAFKLNDQTDSLFLYQIIKSDSFQQLITNLATGTTAKGINQSSLKRVKVYLPTRREQKKVGKFLEVLDLLLSNLLNQKTTLTKYKKALLQKIFSQEIRFKDENGEDFPEWEEKKLSEVANIYDGTHQTPIYVEKGVPFYSVENVTNDNFRDIKYISEEVYEKEKERVIIEKGDILMTRIGDVGNVKLINWQSKASFYVSLALIKPISKVLPIYVCFSLQSHDLQKEIWQKTIHAAFPKKINLGEIGKCTIKIPCKEEQQKIGQFLTDVDSEINDNVNQLKVLEKFKQGIIQKIFI